MEEVMTAELYEMIKKLVSYFPQTQELEGMHASSEYDLSNYVFLSLPAGLVTALCKNFRR